jgi:hypothetical protein
VPANLYPDFSNLKSVYQKYTDAENALVLSQMLDAGIAPEQVLTNGNQRKAFLARAERGSAALGAAPAAVAASEKVSKPRKTPKKPSTPKAPKAAKATKAAKAVKPAQNIIERLISDPQTKAVLNSSFDQLRANLAGQAAAYKAKAAASEAEKEVKSRAIDDRARGDNFRVRRINNYTESLSGKSPQVEVPTSRSRKNPIAVKVSTPPVFDSPQLKGGEIFRTLRTPISDSLYYLGAPVSGKNAPKLAKPGGSFVSGRSAPKLSSGVRSSRPIDTNQINAIQRIKELSRKSESIQDRVARVQALGVVPELLAYKTSGRYSTYYANSPLNPESKQYKQFSVSPAVTTSATGIVDPRKAAVRFGNDSRFSVKAFEFPKVAGSAVAEMFPKSVKRFVPRPAPANIKNPPLPLALGRTAIAGRNTNLGLIREGYDKLVPRKDGFYDFYKKSLQFPGVAPSGPPGKVGFSGFAADDPNSKALGASKVSDDLIKTTKREAEIRRRRAGRPKGVLGAFRNLFGFAGGTEDSTRMARALQSTTKSNELLAIVHKGEAILTAKQTKQAGLTGLQPEKYKRGTALPRFAAGAGAAPIRDASSSIGSPLQSAAAAGGLFNTFVGDLFLLQEISFGLTIVTQTLGKAFIEANAQLEVYLTSLRTTLGTTEKANIAFNDFAKSFALQVPFFATQDIVNVVNKLSGEGFGLDAITGNLDKEGKRFQGSIAQSIIDLASAFGKGPDEAVDAFISATQNRFVRIRQFGISKDALKTFGFSGKREDSAGAAEALQRLINVRFGGITATLGKTFKGAASNVQDFTQTIVQLSTQRAFNKITEYLVGVTEGVNVLADTLGKAEADMSDSTRTFVTYLRDGVGTALEGVTDRFLKFLSLMKSFAPQFLAVGTALLAPFAIKKGVQLGALAGAVTARAGGFPFTTPFGPASRREDIIGATAGAVPGGLQTRATNLASTTGFGLLQLALGGSNRLNPAFGARLAGAGFGQEDVNNYTRSAPSLFSKFFQDSAADPNRANQSLDERFSSLFETGGTVRSAIPQDRQGFGSSVFNRAEQIFSLRPFQALDETMRQMIPTVNFLGAVFKLTLLAALFDVTQAFRDLANGFTQTARVLAFKELKANLAAIEGQISSIIREFSTAFNTLFNTDMPVGLTVLNAFTISISSFLNVINEGAKTLSSAATAIRGTFDVATSKITLLVGAVGTLIALRAGAGQAILSNFGATGTVAGVGSAIAGGAAVAGRVGAAALSPGGRLSSGRLSLGRVGVGAGSLLPAAASAFDYLAGTNTAESTPVKLIGSGSQAIAGLGLARDFLGASAGNRGVIGGIPTAIRSLAAGNIAAEAAAAAPGIFPTAAAATTASTAATTAAAARSGSTLLGNLSYAARGARFGIPGAIAGIAAGSLGLSAGSQFVDTLTGTGRSNTNLKPLSAGLSELSKERKFLGAFNADASRAAVTTSLSLGTLLLSNAVFPGVGTIVGMSIATATGIAADLISRFTINSLSTSGTNTAAITNQLGNTATSRTRSAIAAIAGEGDVGSLLSSGKYEDATAKLEEQRQRIIDTVLPNASDFEKDGVNRVINDYAEKIKELQALSGVINPLDPEFVATMKAAAENTKALGDQVARVEKEISTAGLDSTKIGEDIFLANLTGDKGLASTLRVKKQKADDDIFKSRGKQLTDLRKSNNDITGTLVGLNRARKGISDNLDTLTKEGSSTLLEKSGIADIAGGDLAPLRSNIDKYLKATDKGDKATAKEQIEKVFANLGVPVPKDFDTALKQYGASASTFRGQIEKYDAQIKSTQEQSRLSEKLQTDLVTKQIGFLEGRIEGVLAKGEAGKISGGQVLSETAAILAEGAFDPAISTLDEFVELMSKAEKQADKYAEGLREVGLVALLTEKQQKQFNDSLKLFDQIDRARIEAPTRFGNFTTGQQLTISEGKITALQNRLARLSESFVLNKTERDELGDVVTIGGTNAKRDPSGVRNDLFVQTQTQLNDEVAKRLDLYKQELNELRDINDAQRKIAATLRNASKSIAEIEQTQAFRGQREFIGSQFLSDAGAGADGVINKFSLRALFRKPDSEGVVAFEERTREAQKQQQEKLDFDEERRQIQKERAELRELVGKNRAFRAGIAFSDKPGLIAAAVTNETGRNADETERLIRPRVGVADPAFERDIALKDVELAIRDVDLLIGRATKLGDVSLAYETKLQTLREERLDLLKKERDLQREAIAAESQSQQKRFSNQENIARGIAGRDLTPSQKSVFGIQKLNDLLGQFERLRNEGAPREKLEGVLSEFSSILQGLETVLPQKLQAAFRDRLSAANKVAFTASTEEEQSAIRLEQLAVARALDTNKLDIVELTKALGLNKEQEAKVGSAIGKGEGGISAIAARLGVPVARLREIFEKRGVGGFDGGLTGPEIFSDAVNRFNEAVSNFSSYIKPPEKKETQAQIEARNEKFKKDAQVSKEQKENLERAKTFDQRGKPQAPTTPVPQSALSQAVDIKKNEQSLAAAKRAQDYAAKNPFSATVVGLVNTGDINAKIGQTRGLEALGITNVQKFQDSKKITKRGNKATLIPKVTAGGSSAADAISSIESVDFQSSLLATLGNVIGNLVTAASAAFNNTTTAGTGSSGEKESFGKAMVDKIEAGNKYAKEQVALLTSLLSKNTSPTQADAAKSGDTANISQGAVVRNNDGFGSTANKNVYKSRNLSPNMGFS